MTARTAAARWLNGIVDERRPFDRAVLLARLLPFAAASVLILLSVLLELPPRRVEWLLVAAAGTAVTILAALLLHWERLPPAADLVPPCMYLGVVAALRHSSGGHESGYDALVILSLLWLALFDTPRHLAVGLGVAAMVLVAPILLVGAPDYPPSEWRRVLIDVGLGGMGGYMIQRLVMEVRFRSTEIGRQNDELRDHETDLARLLTVATELGRAGSHGTSRRAICDAARTILDADLALLFERRPDDDLLIASAGSPEGELPPALRLSRQSLAARVLAAQEATFVGDMDADPRIDHEAARLLAVRAAYFQPIVLDALTVGVLIGYWRQPRSTPSARARSMMALFAAQAATAIERSDLLGRLEALATTDPLTGVLNRRALESALARELATSARTGESLSVVLLDIDHFKALNDARGHAAGDAVLVATTTAWSAELRPGDALGRYGGEEFVVVAPRCPASGGVLLANRLRAAMPPGVTVSAGAAEWDGREEAITLLARADAALYRAKRAGRDRASVASRPLAPASAREDPRRDVRRAPAASRTRGSGPRSAKTSRSDR